MKVKTYSWTYEGVGAGDEVFHIEIDGKEVFETVDDLGPDGPTWDAGYGIPAMLRDAHAAGLRGEVFELIETTDRPPSYNWLDGAGDDCTGSDCLVCAREREQEEGTLTKEKAK